MAANPTKSQLIIMKLGKEYKLCMKIDKIIITAGEQLKLFGVIIDSKLRFIGIVNSL